LKFEVRKPPVKPRLTYKDGYRTWYSTNFEEICKWIKEEEKTLGQSIPPDKITIRIESGFYDDNEIAVNYTIPTENTLYQQRLEIYEKEKASYEKWKKTNKKKLDELKKIKAEERKEAKKKKLLEQLRELENEKPRKVHGKGDYRASR